jgi:hypothetical protein
MMIMSLWGLTIVSIIGQSAVNYPITTSHLLRINLRLKKFLELTTRKFENKEDFGNISTNSISDNGDHPL